MTQREQGLPVIYGSRVRVLVDDGVERQTAQADEEPEYATYWQDVPDDFGSTRAVAPPIPRPAARAPEARFPRRVEPKPELSIPRRRARKPARPKGKRTNKSTEQLARDHYLDYPTHIKAAKITLACTPALARRARLTGEHVDRSKPGRPRAQGAARLVLRELTLEAERISICVHPEGVLDLTIMARGNVHLVSEIRGNVNRETGIRSLLITNDRIVPLR